MTEEPIEYTLIDEDGDKIKVTFIHRYCNCFNPGCVDNAIEITIPGDEYPCRVEIPRIITQFIEGVFNGNLKVSNDAGSV